MKKNSIELNTKCPCGHDLVFEVQKPVAFTPSTTKVECIGCKSVFLFKAKVGKNRKVDIEMGVQELSSICEKILQKDIDDRQKAESKGNGSKPAPRAVKVAHDSSDSSKITNH